MRRRTPIQGLIRTLNSCEGKVTAKPRDSITQKELCLGTRILSSTFTKRAAVQDSSQCLRRSKVYNRGRRGGVANRDVSGSASRSAQWPTAPNRGRSLQLRQEVLVF